MAEPVSLTPGRINNWDLLVPYVAPYFLYVAIASFSADRVAREWSYLARLTTVPLVLAWAWRWYAPLRGPRPPAGSVALGGLFGVLGLGIWLSLAAPFAPKTGEPWSVGAFLLRLAASALVVPVFEELFMRGYVLRVALQWDQARRDGLADALGVALHDRCLDEIPAGAWSVSAVLVSTLVFAAGHGIREWPAAVAYGALMAALWVVRKDLLSCVVAHSVTNLALGIYVWRTGEWGLW